jgi:hypothetical protein
MCVLVKAQVCTWESQWNLPPDLLNEWAPGPEQHNDALHPIPLTLP